MTVRTDKEQNDVVSGQSPGRYSVLDLSFSSKFYVGGVIDHAVDVVSSLYHSLHTTLGLSLSVSLSLSLSLSLSPVYINPVCLLNNTEKSTDLIIFGIRHPKEIKGCIFRHTVRTMSL